MSNYLSGCLIRERVRQRGRPGVLPAGPSTIPVFRLFMLPALLFFGLGAGASAQQLQVTYGTKGIQNLSFGGTVLEDTSAYPSDSFHIFHMKCEDLQGRSLTSGQYGWGESNNGTSWDAATHTETYKFSWGSIAVQFLQHGNTLDLLVTEINSSASGVRFDGAEIYPVFLHFPQDPQGFGGYSQFLNTTTGPAVSVADYGQALVTAVLPDESRAMYGGWKSAGGSTYSPLMTSTVPDGLADFLPHTDLPLASGNTLQYTVSLRFTAAGVSADASDAYRSFAATYPSQMTWTDHRIIGTAYLASSPANTSGKTKAGGFPTNPRRYYNDASIDVTNASGLQQFQKRILAQAESNVTNARMMNGQGVVTWDLEGEQYPQDTTYVCSPEQIATVAPEMESTVLDRQSAYFGMKLDDAYFKTMTSAGLRVGVCIRPQVFTLSADGTASQSFLDTNQAIIANLEKKIAFANTRWGATIFYIDSTVSSNGGTLDPAIIQKVNADYPAFLLIPEETTPRYYAYSAPFYSFIFHGTTGTEPSVYQYYPKAFGANLVNDAGAAALQNAVPNLIKAVSKGDILMGHADYWQANNPALVSIYEAAGISGTRPPQVTPAISWAVPESIVYGTPLSDRQLNASAPTAGTFTYSPAAGSILPGGVNTLVAIFAPLNTTDYTSAVAGTTINVKPASPVLSWPAPAPLVYGAPLDATRLNASSNAAGAFSYSPAAGTVLQAGTTVLKASFAPTEPQNYLPVQTSTNIIVNRAKPVLTWSPPLSVSAGTRLSAAQLNASANIPGVFTYVPPAGTVVQQGTTVLLANFAPADTANYDPALISVGIIATATPKTVPRIVWSPAAGIVYGSPLTSQQLNASTTVPGTFQYSPGLGTRLGAGLQALQATFFPSDAASVGPATATVSLMVEKAQPQITWHTPDAIVAGTPLSNVQLNAQASVPGEFRYTPTLGEVLPAGGQSLKLVFVPADASNYLVGTVSVNLQVNAAPIAQGPLLITTPADHATVQDSIVISAICRLPLDPAGSYLMVDGAPIGTRRVVDGPYIYPLDTRTLTNGTHSLQIWAHDIGNNVTVSPAVTVIVAN